MAPMTTPSLEKLKLTELLYEALAATVGIIVRTNDVTLLRQRLYEIRKEDANLLVLSFSPSPVDPNSELWIYRNEQTTPGEKDV